MSRMLSKVWRKKSATARKKEAAEVVPATPGPSPAPGRCGTPLGLLRPVQDPLVGAGEARCPKLPTGFDGASSPPAEARGAAPTSPELREPSIPRQDTGIAPPAFPAREERPASPEMALWDAIAEGDESPGRAEGDGSAGDAAAARGLEAASPAAVAAPAATEGDQALPAEVASKPAAVSVSDGLATLASLEDALPRYAGAPDDGDDDAVAARKVLTSLHRAKFAFAGATGRS